MTSVSGEVQELRSFLKEFYTTNDKVRRKILDEQLVHLQNGNSSWHLARELISLDEVDGSCPIYEILFAFNCLYSKLKSAHFFKQIAESQEGVERAFEFLLSLCERYSTKKVLTNKACCCLCVYLLKMVPDIVEDPFTILFEKWYPRFPILIMNVFGGMCDEFRVLAQPLPRRTNVRSYLRQNEKKVLYFITQILQNSNSTETEESCIKCVQSWISMEGCDLNDWTSVIIFCLSKLNAKSSSDLFNTAAKFFESFVSNTNLYKMENFLDQLYQFAGVLVNYGKTLEIDDVTLEDIIKMVEQLCSHHTKVFIRLLVSEPVAQHVLDILHFFVDISSARGYYMLDETISLLTVNFWFNFYEEIWRYTDNSAKDTRDRFRPVFFQLWRNILFKIQLPPVDVFQLNFTADDREKFLSYRQEFVETMLCCYRVCGPAMTHELLNRLESLTTHGLANLDKIQLDVLEALFFVFVSLSPFSNLTDPSIRKLCCHLLPNYIEEFSKFLDSKSDVRSQLIVSLLQLLENFSDTIVQSLLDFHEDSSTIETGNGDSPLSLSLLAILKGFCIFFTKFFAQPCAVLHASGALKNFCKLFIDDEIKTRILLKSSAEEIQSAFGEIVSMCMDVFQSSDVESKNLLSALKCCCLLLGSCDEITVVQFLNALIAPRLNRLRTICQDPAFHQKIDLNHLLFELDVICVLISSLSIKQVSRSKSPSPYSEICDPLDQKSQPKPHKAVFSVVCQSMPLLKEILLASRNEKSVAEKLCDVITSAIVVLQDDAEPLLRDICDILAVVFPPHSKAFQVSSKLVLIFWSNFVSESLLVEFFQHLFAGVESLGVHDDSVADFFDFCAQICRKTPAFFTKLFDQASAERLVKFVDLSLIQGDNNAVKRVALFLRYVYCISFGANVPCSVILIFNQNVSATLIGCLKRLCTEHALSTVDCLAEALFAIMSNPTHAEAVRNLKANFNKNQHFWGMFNELGNKSKYREFAKRLNAECRRGSLEF